MGAATRELWRQVFARVERCRALLPQMPFPDQALQIQQSLPGNPELVEQQIAVLETRCPLVPFADAAAIESDRA